MDTLTLILLLNNHSCTGNPDLHEDLKARENGLFKDFPTAFRLACEGPEASHLHF